MPGLDLKSQYQLGGNLGYNNAGGIGVQ